MVINTALPICIVIGIWLHLVILIFISFIIWMPLSLYTIISMAHKFGDSYMILFKKKYSLNNTKTMPRVYIVISWLLLFIASCIAIIGLTIDIFCESSDNDDGLSEYSLILWAIYEIMKAFIVAITIYMLRKIKNQFQQILIQNASLLNDSHSNETGFKTPLLSNERKRNNKKQMLYQKPQTRKTAKSAIIPEEDDYDEIDEKKIYSLNIESSSHGMNSILNSQTPVTSTFTAINHRENTDHNDKYGMYTNKMLKGEIERMRILIIVLYGGILLCLICSAYYLCLYTFLRRISGIFGVTVGVNSTTINVFLLWFSWIPKHQIKQINTE